MFTINVYVCMYVCMYVSGTMVSLTQRKDSELELITGDSLGQLLYWDIDVRDPVMAVQGNLLRLFVCMYVLLYYTYDD